MSERIRKAQLKRDLRAQMKRAIVKEHWLEAIEELCDNPEQLETAIYNHGEASLPHDQCG